MLYIVEKISENLVQSKVCTYTLYSICLRAFSCNVKMYLTFELLLTGVENFLGHSVCRKLSMITKVFFALKLLAVIGTL